MIMANTTITHLDISWNDLGVDGGLVILNGLKHNSTIVDLQLSGSKVSEDTIHEVAFVLRRNRSAAAYKVGSTAAADVQAAMVDATISARGIDPLSRTAPSVYGGGYSSMTRDIGMPPATTTGRQLLSGSPRGAASSMFAARSPGGGGGSDESSLMVRLMMKQRECILPEDQKFYHQVAEHIDKLQLEASKHKQGRLDGEDREKLATTGFADREHRYAREIKLHEDNLHTMVADKENLQQDISKQSSGLRALGEDNSRAIRESVAAQEQAASEEQQLRNELRDVMREKRELQEQLGNHSKDLEMLQQENERLRAHVKCFQQDVHDILV
eukprot:NODE_1118_length_1236_cov_482.482642.p1 GENE.NODE_1118_length_1236_cov_482.482642~~NODE_1118_length_1236_cov_482.482642.p1  ORF type:complete len:353 (+),score=130.82 NODE_1118_length_1236_cov_482.482642:77-1060(+)